MSNAKQIVDSFIQSVGENPSDWEVSTYSVTHKPTFLRFDLINWPFIAIDHPFSQRLGFVQSLRFRHFLSKFRSWKAQNMMSIVE